MKKEVISAPAVIFCFLLFIPKGWGCTNLLATSGATDDGSVMITYTCDGEFHPRLHYTPAADYEEGEKLEIKDWSGEVRGEIDQVRHTYAVMGLMNEHQVVIGETTFDGRKELQNPDGLLHYWDLMSLALQRAATAREAVEVMTGLVEEHGYRSTGETFSIGDKHEAWILEMIGPGPGGAGAVWVAVKVPDGFISCHANKARIGAFPMDDPDNCLYSENVISFAVEKGYYDPETDGTFRFCEAYCPATPKNRRYTDGRVWSIFRRAAPSLNLSPAYYRGEEDAEPYPFWIRPDEKLDLKKVFDLMRDHFEGTDYDMRKGIDAGPYGLPYRWRPMHWTANDVEYAWERPVSTQQTAFSFVSQSRSSLPDPIGGVYWYGLDDTYVTCYIPFYCCNNEIPSSFAAGNLSEFSTDSAWWIFNLAANYANLKYSIMIKEIQAVQHRLEGKFIELQPAVEKTAVQLFETNPQLMVQYLTDYSVSHAEIVADEWRELCKLLITKYNDGYVKSEDGGIEDSGYPQDWLRRVIKERSEQFRLQEKAPGVPETDLTD